MRAGAGVRAAAVLIGLAAVATRLPTLGLQSYDEFESYTVALVHKDLGAMLDALPSYEGTPPLYYLVAWVWSRVIGDGEFALRSLSALCGIATVPLAYASARTLGSRRMALAAAALVALSPIAVWYSQEARAYSLLTLFAGAAFLFFAREVAGRGRSAWNLGAWAALAALALATHYFAVLVVAPEAVWLLARARAGRRLPVLGAVAVPLVVGLALIPLAGSQEPHAGGGETTSTSLLHRVPQVAKQLLVGYNLPAEALLAVAAALGCVAAAWFATRRAEPEERRGAAVGAGVAGAAAVLLLALAVVGVDYFLTRYLTVVLVPAAVALAAGFAASKVPWVAFAAFLAVLVAVNVDPLAQRPDFRGALDGLGPPPPGGRAVLVSSLGVHLEIFQPGARPMPSSGVPVREVVVVGLAVVGGDIHEHPRAALALVPREFKAVSVRRTGSYVRVVMRAKRPTPFSPVALFDAGRLGLGPLVLSYVP